MKIITSPDMPSTGGHYSQCIEHAGTVYISGQLPVDPLTKEIPDTIEGQTLLVLNKTAHILKVAGLQKTDVIQVRVYITGIHLWGKVNEVYAAFFGEHKPVRCIVPVSELHYGCMIEIELTAQNVSGS